MDDVLDGPEAIARRCERVAKRFHENPLDTMIQRLTDAVEDVGRSSSNSWLGYQSTIYLRGFRPALGGEFFDTEWGDEYGGRSRGDWSYATYDGVLTEIQRRASVPDLSPIEKAAQTAEETFERSRSEFLPLLDMLLSVHPETALEQAKDRLNRLTSHTSTQDFLKVFMPKGQMISRDMRAMSGGMRPPHHIAFRCWLVSQESYGVHLKELAEIARYVKHYLEIKHKMKGKSIAKTEGKITIGHGSSDEWRTLKEFIQDRLKLEVDEFNQSSPAGLTTKERLEEMLDDSCFAFLIMTAEDEHADGTMHARENVIHESGLFQGRLGFRRAIVLLENGCKEFSNIVGLSQIRFDAGRMSEKFEEIRKVLEREGIIK